MSDPTDKERVVSDEQRARAMLEQLKSVHAADIGRDMVIAAVNYSYPKLGLSDETHAVRNLSDVRVSIELIRAILEVLDREAGAQTSDLHDTLAQMQLAYAHAVQLANAERAAGAEDKAADAPPPEPPQAPEPEAAPAEPEAAQAEPPSGEADAEAGGAEATVAPEETPQPQGKPAGAKRTAGAKKAAARPAAKKAPARKPVAKKKPDAKKKPAGES